MTFVQLEYIICLRQSPAFYPGRRLLPCYAATLSMQIKAGRGAGVCRQTNNPLCLRLWVVVIAQVSAYFRKEMRSANLLSIRKGSLPGELRIGIIPRWRLIYCLYLFNSLPSMQVRLVINWDDNRRYYPFWRGAIDAGILVTPLQQRDKGMCCFMKSNSYTCRKDDALYRKHYVLAQDIDLIAMALEEATVSGRR